MSIVKPDNTQDPQLASLLGNLGELIRQARLKVLRAVDTAQVQTCWQIGRHIVEFEQEGARRAVYGKQLLATLAKVLTTEFGKGFDETNLRKNAPVLSGVSNSRRTASRIELDPLPQAAAGRQ
jgi:hypothetical protein